MKLTLRAVTLVFAILWLSAVYSLAQKPQISSIQARLFYENTGTFSDNVLTEDGFDLWNTPFDWVYSTFVTVELTGVPKYLQKPRTVELSARYIPIDNIKRRIRVRQMEKIRNGSESGRAYAGFWLKNVGCEPVYLVARLIGEKRVIRETIKFGCGE